MIADGKRGDISVSASAYAQALIGGVQTPFGAVAGLGADMVTVNPLMGGDAVEPFVAAARAAGARGAGAGAHVEPGRGRHRGSRAGRWGSRLGAGRADRRRAGHAPGAGQAGISDVGAVVGATVPGHLSRARELMPHATFLLPGVGAQGGRVEDLAPAFAPGRAGGLVTASRSIAGAHLATGGDPASAARAEAERLREAAWELSRQVR